MQISIDNKSAPSKLYSMPQRQLQATVSQVIRQTKLLLQLITTSQPLVIKVGEVKLNEARCHHQQLELLKQESQHVKLVVMAINGLCLVCKTCIRS